MADKRYHRKTLNLPNGKRIDIYAKSRAELDEKVLEAKMSLRLGVDLSADTTFGDYALMWFNTYKKPYLRPSSQQILTTVLNNHIFPYIAHLPIKNIIAINIQQIMNAADCKSKSLNNKILTTLRAVFDSAVDNNIIPKSPVPIRLRAGGKSTDEKEALSSEQEQILLKALEGTGQTYLFVLMGLKTGLRRGELLGLMWDAIDLDKGEIKVFRNLVISNGKVFLEDTTKTKSGIRTVPIPPQLLEELKAERAKTNSLFVFHKQNGEMMSHTAFKNLWQKVESRRMNLSTEKKSNRGLQINRIINFDVTPHILRHTYITRLFEAGLDIKEVQYLAGHSDVAMTLKIYTHYSESRKTDTFAKVREALG